MGRMSTWEVWEELGIIEDKLKIMQNLAYHGAKLGVIARAADISVRTLERMRKPESDIFEPRVYKALYKGRGALVGDIGKTLLDWVNDEKIDISLRIPIAKDLYRRHGDDILDLKDVDMLKQIKQLMGMVVTLENVVKIKDMEIAAIKSKAELDAESGEGGETGSGERVFYMTDGDDDEPSTDS